MHRVTFHRLSTFRVTPALLRIRTHFDLLGIPVSASSVAAVDTARLQKSLHALQRRFHPDALVGKDHHEVERCEAIAAAVNAAYKVVKDDFSRYRYIAYCVAFLDDIHRHSGDNSTTTTTTNSSDFEIRKKVVLSCQEDLAARDEKTPHASLQHERRSDSEKSDSLMPNHQLPVLEENDDFKLGQQLDVEFLERMLDFHEEIEDAADEEGGELSSERKAEMLKEIDQIAAESHSACTKCLTDHGNEFWEQRIAAQYFSDEDKGNIVLSPEAAQAQTEFIRSVLRWTYARNLQTKIRDLDS